MMGALVSVKPKHPYPGLRPFEPEEWPIFFGREKMIDDVIDRLARQSLVLIHGSSGCGKSSLVRAGVLPRLDRQHQRYGAPWLACAMRPSGGPMWNLAGEFARLEGRPTDVARVGEILRLCSRRDATLSSVAGTLSGVEGKRLCLLVDQFEELFRFAKETSQEEAELFVDLLSRDASPEQENLPLDGPKVHVIVTMRSEFLGECARFDGLAEAINRTQYLVPRMSRDDLMRAIRRPAQLYGGEVGLDLADRLVEEGRSRDDELPLIQHGLMLIWNDAAQRTEPGQKIVADARLLDEAGGLGQLLSGHADKVMALAAPGAERQWIVQQLFRALTDINAEGQAIRRPQSFSGLVAATGGSAEDTQAIVDAFRGDGVSFLTPYEPAAVTSETVIDISHEALVRCWLKIADPQDGWLKKEFNDGLIWRSLLVEAREFEANPKHVLSRATTNERQTWIKRKSREWSERFGGNWDLVARLISASKSASDRQSLKEKVYVSVLVSLTVGASLFANYALDARDTLSKANETIVRTTEAHKVALNELVEIAYPKKSDQNLHQDNSKLLKIYQDGAEAGNDRSMYVFGVMCLSDPKIQENKKTGLHWIHKAIEAGNVDAMMKLAQMLQEGQDVQKDDAEAIRLLRNAAQRNDAEAMNSLALSLLKLHQDEVQVKAEAIELLRAASERGNPAAKNNLARVLESNSKDVGQDETKTFQLYREAAEAGDVNANYNLGTAYLLGRGVARNDAEARKFFRIAADAGNPAALNGLGDMYRHGRGVLANDVEAVKFYRKAADAGNAAAMNALGEMYAGGLGGLKESDAEALRYFRLAESLGDPVAMRNLGEIYLNGRGVAKDASEAARFFREAVEKGFFHAMVDLAILYRDGTGVTKDYVEATRLLRTAASKNDPDAQYLLGLLHENGRGIPKDEAQAFKLYSMAKDQGHAGAMSKLAGMYLRGAGVTKNENEARRYTRMAAEVSKARDALEKVSEDFDNTLRDNIPAYKCQIIINGHDYYNSEPCTFRFTSGVGFSFGGGRDGHSKYAVRVIFPSPGVARGFWNGPAAGEKITADLGELKRSGACWLNDAAKICAWSRH
jgi:TPR repeat protein/energy-coupling factor transporter ATP-binding protein EcfA2